MPVTPKSLAILLIGFWMGIVLGLRVSSVMAAHEVPGDFASITAALAAASPGDTIVVAAGVYSPSSNGETFPLIADKDSLYLIGAGMGQSIIDAESSGTVLSCDGVVGGRVSGFTITGGWANRGGGIWVRPGTPVEIDHNLIAANGALFQGAAMMVHADAWVHHNVVWESFDIDIADEHDPHGVVTELDVQPLFEHNLFGRGDGNGLIVHDPSAPTVRHNIFYENGTPPPDARGRGICWFSTMPLVVYHNLFFDNAVAALLVPALGGNFSGEDANDLFPDDGIYGNLDADPLLADPDNADFNLSWGSPAIDAGDSTLPGDPDGTIADLGPFFFDQSGAGVGLRETPAVVRLSILSSPFDPTATLQLRIPEPGPASIAVYDVHGRRLAVLAEGRFQAGSHEVDWDRTNDSGNKVGPGVYFLRLRVGDFYTTRKIVLLR